MIKYKQKIVKIIVKIKITIQKYDDVSIRF